MNVTDVSAKAGAGPFAAAVSTPIVASTLKRLFDVLKVPVQAGALTHACQSTQQVNTDCAPVERVNRILAAVQLRGIQVAQMRWDRLDRRRLPALVFFEQAWCVVELVDAGAHANDSSKAVESLRVRVTGSDAQVTELDPDALDETPVLWLHPQAQAESTPFQGLQSRAARLVLSEILQDKRWLADVLVATLVVNVLAIATSLFAMQVYDRVVPTFSYATLTALSVGMVLVTVIDWVLKFIRAKILDKVAKEVDLSVSQKVFDHVLRLRLDTRPRSLGSLAAQMNGLDSVRAFFSSTIVFTLTDLPFALLFVGVIVAIGGPIGWVYLALLPVAVAVGWFAQHRLRELSRLELKRGTERQGLLVETLQGAETLQSSGASWRFAEGWRTMTGAMAHYGTQAKLITTTTMTTAGSLGSLAYVLVIVIGVTRIEAGVLTIGGLMACTILGGRVIGPVTQSVQILSQWQQVREALQMVNGLLSLETTRRDEQVLLTPDESPQSVSLEGIRFAYPNSPVLRINIPLLSFKAGDRVVVLGPIGSGKSTLLKVAAGLYKPSEGRVRLGQADLWELDPQVLSEQVSYLPQDVSLFKGTLRSNLALAGGISDSRLLETVKLLGIDQIAADSPRSMDLEISEGGQGLSGGQRQLVGLGRMFLARPTVWLLDEPTASLDPETEARVLQAIVNVVRPSDILVIATHRLRLANLANRVIVMRRGQIAADGPPEAIFANMKQQAARVSTA
jgi:ATP-binding cassette subfamily C protein LapB